MFLLEVSDNIIKIMPVHKNREFLAVRMCELWYPCTDILFIDVLPSIFFGSNPGTIFHPSVDDKH